jgi:hypothetical protein
MAFLSVSLVSLDVNNTQGKVILCFRYLENIGYPATKVIIAENIQFDIKITGKFHEVTFLSRGQRTERDPLLLVAKAQRLIDEVVNES